MQGTNSPSFTLTDSGRQISGNKTELKFGVDVNSFISETVEFHGSVKVFSKSTSTNTTNGFQSSASKDHTSTNTRSGISGISLRHDDIVEETANLTQWITIRNIVIVLRALNESNVIGDELSQHRSQEFRFYKHISVKDTDELTSSDSEGVVDITGFSMVRNVGEFVTADVTDIGSVDCLFGFNPFTEGVIFTIIEDVNLLLIKERTKS